MSKKLLIDVPEGWKYGFPKEITDKDLKDTKAFLIRKGYPLYKIEEYGESFYYRFINGK